jgi:putative oxidoreductase
MHGGQKFFSGFENVAGMMHQVGIPFPMLAAVVVTIVEFFGGIALALGLFARWIAALIAIEMLVAVLKVHLRGGFFLPRGYEYALTLLAASLVLAAAGPGAAAVDALRSKRKA